jgi:hypothetical protein
MVTNVLCCGEVGANHSTSRVREIHCVEAGARHLVAVLKTLSVVAKAKVPVGHSGIVAANAIVGRVQQWDHTQIAQVLYTRTNLVSGGG